MAVPERHLPAAAEVTFQQVQRMAEAAAKSGMFGVKTQEQALTLMLLAQAEGIHPMTAVRDYHVIQGRPSLKADTMMARFIQAGGRVEWHTLSDAKVEATFSHAAGGTARIVWTMEMAKNASLAGKDNWKAYPRAMLRSRVISEGVRTVFPGVIAGVYTPEEVVDIDPELPASKDERINTFERPGLLQSIVDEWLQQIKETSDERALRQVLSGALAEAKAKGDEQRIGTFILAHDAQLELIREAAAKLKQEGSADASL